MGARPKARLEVGPGSEEPSQPQFLPPESWPSLRGRPLQRESRLVPLNLNGFLSAVWG